MSFWDRVLDRIGLCTRHRMIDANRVEWETGMAVIERFSDALDLAHKHILDAIDDLNAFDTVPMSDAVDYISAVVENLRVPIIKFNEWVDETYDPKSVESYYWTREWQDNEKIAETEIASGDTKRFATGTDAIRWLELPHSERSSVVLWGDAARYGESDLDADLPPTREDITMVSAEEFDALLASLDDNYD